MNPRRAATRERCREQRLRRSPLLFRRQVGKRTAPQNGRGPLRLRQRNGSGARKLRDVGALLVDEMRDEHRKDEPALEQVRHGRDSARAHARPQDHLVERLAAGELPAVPFPARVQAGRVAVESRRKSPGLGVDQPQDVVNREQENVNRHEKELNVMREDEFERKRDVALDILAKTGMWKYRYRPPLLVLLWYIGVKIPPFLLADIGTIIFYQTVPVTIFFGLFYTLVSIMIGFIPLTVFIVLSTCCLFWIGYTIGVLLLISHLRRNYKLPRWSEL
jgi:hypothetical protein